MQALVLLALLGIAFGDNVPCKFSVPFIQWESAPSCPPRGQALSCSTTSVCTHLPHRGCIDAQFAPLTCQNGLCMINTLTTPSFSTPAGTCDTSTKYSVCALCTNGSCSGNALCVPKYACEKTTGVTMQCYALGYNNATA
jgi:hypothetical protein